MSVKPATKKNESHLMPKALTTTLRGIEQESFIFRLSYAFKTKHKFSVSEKTIFTEHVLRIL